ncbi:hypothetical protein MLD38_005460 [Melastoma candidum]|uniref:Uncharacterized protein n=1 Tax=Melastoma candidum TaxID=119954 RepID=A0ACB9RJF5_9MYRT|nr:hypothetical protein MLD38_005460 [Melastoma candidum]
MAPALALKMRGGRASPCPNAEASEARHLDKHCINVIGEAIDDCGELKTDHYLPIHREAPLFVEQATEQQILVTGIKVVDLLAPYQRGGKIGLFGGAGVGKTVLIMELINNVAKADGCPIRSPVESGFGAERRSDAAFNRADKNFSPLETGAVLCGQRQMAEEITSILVADGVSREKILKNF